MQCENELCNVERKSPSNRVNDCCSLHLTVDPLAPMITGTLVGLFWLFLGLVISILISSPNSYWRVVGAYLLEQPSELLLGVLMIVLALLFGLWRLYSSLEFHTNDTQVIIKRGVIIKREDHLLRSSIYHVTSSQSAIDRMFGVNSFQMHAYGTSTQKITVRGVPDSFLGHIKKQLGN